MKLQTLGELFAERPSVNPAPIPYEGWLFPGTARMLSDLLDERAKCVVEVGSWRGLSTRHILDHAPNAVVYCIDTWLGSKEHPRMFGRHYEYIIANLYEQFVSDCWDYRDRIIPVRDTSHEGLAKAASEEFTRKNVRPNLVYIDGSHEYDDVIGDIELAAEHFPTAVLCGDDYNRPWPGVIAAVDKAALELGRMLHTHHPGWRMTRL